MINDRFVIKCKLGEGRSKVFLCSDLQNNNKEFAIKILKKDSDNDELKTFREEFFILQRLNHPNIISAYEEGTIAKVTDEIEEISVGSRFITLDYFEGVELLKYTGLNNEEILRKIITQVCSVLYYLHQSNYIYYDLKLENILAGTVNGEPVIKLIDMGLAYYSTSTDEQLIRGTAEYIAPEILRREPHNHLVDLYSFGILLYRIIYGKFPFDVSSEIEIYKAHLEKEFEFSQSHFSHQLIEVVKGLLSKNPIERFPGSLQVLSNLNLEISYDIYKDFLPAEQFTGRQKIIYNVSELINDLNNKEIIIISGYEGAGKTALVFELYRRYENVIVISNNGEKIGIEFILGVLRRIIYSDFVFHNLSLEILNDIAALFDTNEPQIDSLKAVFNKISAETKFILIIDDFNLLDDFAVEIFKELFPILQTGNVKLILTESSEKLKLSEFIYNRNDLILSPYTHDELSEYIDNSFASFFPKDQLKKLIIEYSDLLPGSVVSFIKDIILLKILKFTTNGPIVESGEEAVALLKSSHEEIFKLRLDLLTAYELKIAETISSFGINPDINIIADSLGYKPDKIKTYISNMIQKNILQQTNIFSNPSFTSASLKNYVYSSIPDKESVHKNLAAVLVRKFNEYNRTELARQYELAKNYYECYRTYLTELNEAEKVSAFSYQKKILLHLLEIPLSEEFRNNIKYQLCKTLYKLNDSKSAFELIESILENYSDDEIRNDLLTIKGVCLIEMGEIEKGKQVLVELSLKIADEIKRQKILVEIAYAEFDLGIYDSAKKICMELLNSQGTTNENKGKCYNLLGLLSTYKDNNLDEALKNFQNGLEAYRKDKLLMNQAKIEVNIGNTYNRMGNFEYAEKHWQNSFNANTSIGNLDYEAKILINFGIYYYNRANFEKAIENYKRALNIFSSYGNKSGQGLVLTNLGEIYLTKSEFQNSYESLIKSMNLFNSLKNKEEEAEVIFLLCRLFSIIGDDGQYKTFLNFYNNLKVDNDLTERQNNNYRFLEISGSLIKTEMKINTDILDDIMNDFSQQNEGFFFIEGCFLLFESLIQRGFYQSVSKLLNDNKYIKIYNDNYLSMAQRFYLQSLISSRTNEFDLRLPVELLNEAYELIKDEVVTELTWKVLYALSEHYFQRGNIKKANEYLFYAKEVIKYIADGIENSELKSKYLLKPERSTVIEKEV